MRKMALSSRETEIKLAFPSPASAHDRLTGVGSRLIAGRVFEDNRLYDRPEGSLRRVGLVLRLRRVDGRCLLTLKSPVEGDHRYKVRQEEQTDVGDAEVAHRILTGLGFVVAWRYQKYRTTFRIDAVEATVDETPIGCWVELEGEPSAIDRVAARLGFGPDDYIRGTYYDLAAGHTGRCAGPVPDLVFEVPPR